MGELRRANEINDDRDNDCQRQHGKRNAIPLAHAKGSTDIADKQEVDHTGNNGHMQSIAHRTNCKLGQLVNKQHNQRHPASNTQPPAQRRRHIPSTTQINPLPSKTQVTFNASNHLIVTNAKRAAYSPTLAK